MYHCVQHTDRQDSAISVAVGRILMLHTAVWPDNNIGLARVPVRFGCGWGTDCRLWCVVCKGDVDAEMGEEGYGDDAGDNMMDDYQQSADESDIDHDTANDDYVVGESDDFDVNMQFLFIVCIL